MDKKKIEEITNKAHQPCLVGGKVWDADIQQFTCKQLNGDFCTCYKKYKAELEKHKSEAQ